MLLFVMADRASPYSDLTMVPAAGYIVDSEGPVAQLGERCVRNAEVGSSILLRSTSWSHCLTASCCKPRATIARFPRTKPATGGHGFS